VDSFAFILHPLDPKADVARKYPTLARILPVGMIHFLSLYWPPVVLAHVRSIRSEATGKEVEGWLLACPLTTRRLLQVPPHVAYRKIIQTGRLAERLGARILGLGAYTSVVGDGGITIAQALRIPVTTGDSYTAALSVHTLLEAAAQMGVIPERATAAVVGATGAIGGACAGLLAPRVRRLLLVGRRMEALEEQQRQLSALAAGPVEATTDITEVRTADLVLTATSAGRPVLFPEHLKPGAVVCDVARPRDVSPRVHRERSDVLVVDGGLVELPGRVSLGFNYGLPPGLTFGCIAETIALALEGRFEDYTVGKRLDLERVREIEHIATRHGFRPAPLHVLDRPIPPERIRSLRRERERPGVKENRNLSE